MNKIILLLFTLIWFQGCTLIPCNLDSDLEQLNKSIEHKELVGTYTPIVISQDLPTETHSLSIQLNDDNTFLIESAPEYVFSLYSSKNKFISISGTWKISGLEISVRPDNKSLFMLDWKLYSQNDKLVILIQYGDPDECRGIKLKKAPNNS